MPMKYSVPRDQQMNARTTLKDKITIQENGYTAADGLAYFAEELRLSNPRKKIAIKQKMIDIKLENLKRVQCEVNLEIEQLESQRANLNPDIQQDKVLERLQDIANAEVDLPPNLKKAVTRVQSAFDKKRDLFVSSVKSKEDILNDFISSNDDFILEIYNKTGNGLEWSDFKDIILTEVVV